MITCEYRATGAERKRLVEAVADILGDSARYLGAPTFAYQVGGVTVSKDGAVSFDAEDGAMVALADELERRGFVAEAAQEAADAPVAAIPATEGLTVEEKPQSRQEASVGGMRVFCVELPREGVTDAAIENLRKLTDSKAALIRKALGADRLDIAVTDDAISFPWFDASPEPDMASAASRFLGRLLDVARTQKRVTAREKPVENEKFAFRCFLLKLGFIGAEYKVDRKILLRNLTGSSAFKDGDRRGQGGNDS